MTNTLPDTPAITDDFGHIRTSQLFTANKNRKMDIQVHVIQTIITLLERDIPTHVTDDAAVDHCNVRIQAMKDQHITFYDTSFYRSVHSFFINFIDAFQSVRIGETDVPTEVIERRFLYRELLSELEDFIRDF